MFCCDTVILGFAVLSEKKNPSFCKSLQYVADALFGILNALPFLFTKPPTLLVNQSRVCSDAIFLFY